ncbi:SHOCT domain-containing protein [Crocinitomicaceae bacterium]|nr:SHOCT domain-containing protein [Crocinitomicaceae bacterium]MDB3906597.1 SHOCT domain-containing protein [Crocinitomicaceae bacterium]
MTLGVFGPWQLIALLIIAAIIILIIRAVSGSSRKKSTTQTVIEVRNENRNDIRNNVQNENQSQSSSKYDELEKLNKLRESGALTQEEFEVEKKKILK